MFEKKNGKARALCLCMILALTMSVLCACQSGEGGVEEESAANTEVKDVVDGAVFVGDWVKISKKAEADKKDHNAKVRITKVVTDEDKAKAMVEDYNMSGTNEQVSTENGNDKVSFAAAEYEVVFGKDFPVGEFGITDVTVPFDIVGENGEEKIVFEGADYTGLTKTEQIGSVPQGYDFYPPDHYKGKIVYLVPRGCDSYLFRTVKRDGGYSYIKPEKNE